MSEMTWRQLRDLDCGPVRDLGAAWKAHAEAMTEQTERVRADVVEGHLGPDHFASDTADLVREQLGLTADRFDDDLSDYATVRVATTLMEAADALEAEQRELGELIPLIESHGLEIEGDPGGYGVGMGGGLKWSIARLDPPQWLCDRVGVAKPDGVLDPARLESLFNVGDLIASASGLADQYGDWLRAIMSRAHDADDEAAAALSAMREHPPGLPPRLGASYGDLIGDYRSGLGGEAAEELEAIAGGDAELSPEQVSQWWEGLSETERDSLIERHPEWVGPVDGIPVDDRDTANRAWLDERIERLEPGDATRDDLIRLRDRITEADGSPAAYDETGQPYYLLGFGTEGSGQAIVAIGDPDSADNVNTYVPGTGGGLAGATGLLNRAEAMAFDADRYGTGAETATVMWMGYDAPDGLLEATDDRWAREGSEGLESFTRGLRATGEGDGANLTLTGHSYGSTMVGTAASTEGVDADNVVFVGSPGVGTDTASALGVDEDDVWATRNDQDAIEYGMVHGTDPTAAEFGGNEFTSDAPRENSEWWRFWEAPIGNHSSYWDEENEISRKNQSLIVTGQSEGVR